MRNQDVPSYHQVLKLGLGLGGIINILCAPALAESGPADVTSQAVTNSTQQNDGLETLTSSENAVERDRTRENTARENTAHENVADHLSPALSTASPEPRSASGRPLFTARRVSTDHGSTDYEEKADVQPKPVPWSVQSLSERSRSASSELAQNLSTSEIDHLDLAWGDVNALGPDSWLYDSTEAAESSMTESSMTESSMTAPHVELPRAVTFTSEEEEEEATDLVPAELTQTNAVQTDITQNREEALAEAPTDDAPTDDTPTEEETSLDSDTSTELANRDFKPQTDESQTDEPDLLSELLANQTDETDELPVLDDELGTLRLFQVRSRRNEDLGILRIIRISEEEAADTQTEAPIAFLAGRLGFVNVDNVFRSLPPRQEQIFQSGLALYLSPKLSEDTSIYAIAETNLARYNNISAVNYNEVQVQVGLRQRLLPRTYAQIGWRNQRLYSPGYQEKLFGAQYIDALISHRSILSPQVWLDSFYQVRLGFADPASASRFRQTVTLSLNYGVSQDFRTSLLYQLDFDDYTQIERYDTSQQILGIISYNITPESRISLFGGTRFGRSSSPTVNLDDTFYGAGLNVSVPLF